MPFRWLDPILNPLACLSEPESSPSAEENADVILKRLNALFQKPLKFALSGDRKSILKGQGLDFADLREYNPGDDIRKIDWNVFARTLTPHIREYHEEKQLTLWLMIDLTPSMRFGKQRSKAQLAVELSGLLGLLAEKANHKLGALLMLGTDTRIIPPKAGHAQVQYLTQCVLDALHQSPNEPLQADPLPKACEQLAHIVQKQSTIIILSDFIGWSESWQNALGQVSRKSRMISLFIQDPTEQKLPANIGLMNVLNPETGQLMQVDTHSKTALNAYAKASQARQDVLLNHLKRLGVAVPASTDTAPIDILLALLATGRIAA